MGSSAGQLSFEVHRGGVLARSPQVDSLRDYLTGLVSEGFPPSVSLAIVDSEGTAVESFGGYACTYEEMVPTTAETLYDLASLTKVVCTVTLVLIARQRGALSLQDPVAKWLPGYPQERTTLWHLLTHTSGLVDHRPFYKTCRGRAAVQAAVLAEGLEAEPGSDVVYSDLNYMLLGWVLEACFEQDLDAAFAAEVARPLGLARTMFRPPETERRLCAATELDGDQRATPGLVWGEVHDGNAYALGGVSGHAGLFAPLADLARFVQVLLAPELVEVLSTESVTLMTDHQAGHGEDVRGIGWRLGPRGWGHWPDGTIWHSGFTGTSLLVAPSMGAAVVLLTNSIHPHRHPDEQAVVRSQVHRRVAEALR
jgi:CubicO group peptidase (beta-lactamase class C family)